MQGTTGSIFGNNQQNAATGGGLFGNSSLTKPTTTGLFGTAPSSAPPNSLFGNTTATTQQQPSLFGNTTATNQQQPSLFGNTTATTQQQPSLFGNSGSSSMTTNTAQQQPSLFGTTGTSNLPTSMFSTPATGMFGSAPAGTTGGGGFFGGSTNNAAPQSTFGGGQFGGTTMGGGGFGGGLMGMSNNFGNQQQQQQQQQQQVPTVSAPTGRLFGTVGGPPIPLMSGGGYNLTAPNTMGGGSTMYGGNMMGGNAQPAAPMNAIYGMQFGSGGLQSMGGYQQQLGVAAPAVTTPFGVELKTLTPSQQLDLFKQQLMSHGVDPSGLPEILRLLLPRIGNPNLRTFQLVVHIVGRINDLVNRTKDPELICFAFSRAPTADVAARMQQLCDEQMTAFGPVALQKLMREKKNCPEPRTHYYTVALHGFAGLQGRVQEQSVFFQHFASSLNEMQERQKKAHDEFQAKALSRLEVIRERQVHMTHRLIRLIGALDELAVRAQNFEADDTEISQVEQEYDRLSRHISSPQNSLSSQLPAIKERLRTALSGISAHTSESMPTTTTTTTTMTANTNMATTTSSAVPATEQQQQQIASGGTTAASPLSSGPKQSAIQELVAMAESHHDEIERIKQQIQVLKISLAPRKIY